MRVIAGRFHLAGASVSAFDPESDEGGRGLEAGLDLIETIGRIVVEQSNGEMRKMKKINEVTGSMSKQPHGAGKNQF